jgi:hypothetical protein
MTHSLDKDVIEMGKTEKISIPSDSMKTLQTFKSIHQATEIARDYAQEKGVNVGRAETFAEVWFDAGKDFDKSGPEDLRSHLDMKFNLR